MYEGQLKTWDWWNRQSFQGHCPWTPKGGFTAPHMNSQLQRPACWCMLGYGHKTQSFMKNRDQQKFLDKPLPCMNQISNFPVKSVLIVALNSNSLLGEISLIAFINLLKNISVCCIYFRKLWFKKLTFYKHSTNKLTSKSTV